MKVWIVTHWGLCGIEEETEVVGVFSTEEKANAYVKGLNYHPANQDYFVNGFEMDKE